jgi:lipopolysaccharide export system protein LptC
VRERATLVLSVTLCGGLAFGSYWLAQQARLTDVASRVLGHEIDYTASDITLTRMDKTGRALYTIDAKSLVHYYDDDSGDLAEPHFVGSKANRPEMRLRAERGHTTSDGEEVRLYGKVVLDRNAWINSPSMNARSEYMLAYPDREVVSTDQPVDIRRGGSSIRASAMHYDNATQRAEFQSSASTRYHEVIAPRASRVAAPTAAKSQGSKP